MDEERSKGKQVDAFSWRRKKVIRRPFYIRKNQKGTAFNKSRQTQTETNTRRNISKDSKLFGRMDQVDRGSTHFKNHSGLSTGYFRDFSSAKTFNSILPFQGGGKVGRFGGEGFSLVRGLGDPPITTLSPPSKPYPPPPKTRLSRKQ